MKSVNKEDTAVSVTKKSNGKLYIISGAIAVVAVAAVIIVLISKKPFGWFKSGKHKDTQKASVSQFMDCLLPMPIVDKLTEDCWGSVVGARDQGNGIEDKSNSQYCYWDGKILKDKKTGTYYMFASRWDEANGHNGWFGSNAVYATSDNLYGPYTDKGLLWPDDQGGKGHNVWPLELHKKDPHGKYAIVVSETRGGDVFVSDSLNGPWENIGQLKVNEGYWQSNTCLIARPDGKYEIINRTGDIALSDDLMGTYEIQTRNIWGQVRGMPTECIEDAVMWYSDGLYHVTVNKWDSRNAYYLTSENGIDGWKLNEGSAYQPDEDFLRYTDGTVNHWNKIERPNVYIEDGVVTAMTFSVIDVPKDQESGRDSHGSKVIVVPFDGEELHRFAHEQRDIAPKETEGKKPREDSMAVLGGKNHSLNFGSKKYIQLQRSTDSDSGLFGEELPANSAKNCSIGFLKYSLSKFDPDEVESATLSLIYNDNFGGDSKTNRIIVALADTDWYEGSGSGNEDGFVDPRDVSWDHMPKIIYDPNNIEGTTAVSDEFATALSTDLGYEINIDVTKLIKSLEPGTKNVAFAICEAEGGQNIAICSKESGVNAPLLNIVTNAEEG